MTTSIEVKSSPIHGVGVFTTKDVPAEEMVGAFGGAITAWPYTDKKSPQWEGIYVIPLSDGTGECSHALEIDGAFKFINHAPAGEANCRYGDWPYEMRIYAVRDIENGEELTVDYGCSDGEFDREIFTAEVKR